MNWVLSSTGISSLTVRGLESELEGQAAGSPEGAEGLRPGLLHLLVLAVLGVPCSKFRRSDLPVPLRVVSKCPSCYKDTGHGVRDHPIPL